MIEKPLAGSAQTFSCPSCGGTVTIRAVGITITAVCSSCGSVIDVANDNFKLIAKAAVKTRAIPLPLGRRGTLYGMLWEVIGYSERVDGSGDYPWREYLLFNPYQGFRFLVEADGHWSFVTMLRDEVSDAMKHDSIDYLQQHFRIFNRGSATVKYVMGEFYWRVKVGEKATVADYVAPPLMLSMEKSVGDIVWSRGDYITAQTVADAFKVPLKNLPRQRGVAPNQPSPFSARIAKCKWPCLIAFMLLMVLQMVFVSASRNEVIYERSLHVNGAQRNQTVIADALDVPGDTGNLEFIASSSVDNNWVELSMSLVNDKTQETEEFTHNVEFYHGYDSDGYWREGAQTNTLILSAIAGGKYHIMVEPDAGLFQSGRDADFTLRVVRDVPTWGLFLLALTMVLIYPFYLLLRHRHFEQRRWSECDYAPVIYRHSS